MRACILLVTVLSSGIVWAQSSATYRVEEYVLNSGGAPAQGSMPTSASFRLTLASVGDVVVAARLGSGEDRAPGYLADLGLTAAYLPPGEVSGLTFPNKSLLAWSPSPAGGTYRLYRDDGRSGYGDCVRPALRTPSATDPSVPPRGGAFFYLVTVENRLFEEGTRGFRSDGITGRIGASDLPVCPEMGESQG